MRPRHELCRFTIGIDGRKCGRVARVAPLHYDKYAGAIVKAYPMRDGLGDPFMYCLEHHGILSDPIARHAYGEKKRIESLAAKRARKRGLDKLAARYEKHR